MRLLITRPSEDAEPLAALLGERGIETVLEPLISVTDLEGPEMDLEGVQAMLITSANGIRAFARRQLEQGRGLTVYAVGDASARAAKELGFESVKSATGDVQALAALVGEDLDPDGGALVHVAGTHVAGDLAGMLAGSGFEVRREVIYQSKPSESLSRETREILQSGTLDGVLLFSPRTAGLFARLAAEAGLAQACKNLAAYCLSQAVAEEAQSLDWREIIVAPEPNQDALLKVIEAGV